MAARAGAPEDAQALLAAAKSRPLPVYLLIGEPVRTEPLARQLIDALVPPERRSFNLETYDGRTTSIAPVLDSLRMRGMFPGTKCVWVREPALFLSGEKRSELSEALFEAWGEERRSEAAERLLTLAAMAGWSNERFRAVDWSALPLAEISDLLGRSARREEADLLAAVHRHCLERKLTVSDFQDESGLLEAALAEGLPADTVLLFTASAVDRRKRVVKTIAGLGAMLDLALERERSGTLAAASLEQLIRDTLGRAGKRIAPAAQREIARRAGSDAAAFTSEIEKLCLYVGEAREIQEADVRASFRDLAESWIFDFTRALAQRQSTESLRLLRGLFAHGEPPLRLLAMIARELRILLLARDILGGSLAGKWRSGTTFAEFQSRLLPAITDTEHKAFGKVHPFVLYMSLQNASRIRTETLQRAILRLQGLDTRLKSSAADPRLLLEAFVLDMTRAA